jgi:hypothetical protein
MDEFGRPAWIAAIILGFIWWWPVGLVLLGMRLATRCRRGWGPDGYGRWYSAPGGYGGGSFGPGGSMGNWGWGGSRSSGNAAFDEYRADTLRRLEEEQKEFQAFLIRLRQARDKAEFDQFMDERRRGGPAAG